MVLQLFQYDFDSTCISFAKLILFSSYTPSQADTAVFEALSGAPSADYVNALRWYNHISSFGGERNSFSGQKKDVSSYGSGAQQSQEQKKDDDDDEDVDLFGSDEEDEEAERIKQERLKMYADKKAKSK